MDEFRKRTEVGRVPLAVGQSQGDHPDSKWSNSETINQAGPDKGSSLLTWD